MNKHKENVMSDNNKTTRSSQYQNKPNRKKNKSKGKGINWAGIAKKVGLVIVFFILLVFISGAGLFTYYASSAPDLTDDALFGTYTSELLDRDGEVYYTIGADSREFANPDEYPEILKEAVLSIEDQRFYKHPGVDPIGIARAGIGYVTEGEVVGGGSTITQQLIKLSLFSTSKEDQTIKRKSQEAWLALQLERRLSKEQILTLYLNRVHMAGNVYGMKTAAEQYYGKEVGDLELHEAAMLAGMPKAPNYFNPYKNPDQAKNRRNTVLYAMYEEGYISQDEYDQASDLPADQDLVDQPEELDDAELYLDGYITAVLDEIAEKTDYDPYTAGLKIHTNIDLDSQEFMYNLAHNEDYIASDDELQTAMTLIDPTTGELLAIMGGRNIEGHLSLNRSTENTRNIGSTIKPLTVYAPAIEFNQRSTYEQVVDEPYTVPGTDWSPRNWDREFHGQMSTRDALVNSRNIPTAKIFNEELDFDQVSEFLERLDINPESLASSEGLVPSSAIDGSMTPLQLTGAFSAFANGGQYIQPHTVSEIVTQDGETIDTTPEPVQAMEDYTAYMITDMLKGVIDLYSNDLDISDLPQAGKTGTSNYSSDQHEEYNIPTDQGLVPDSWFVGYTPEYTLSVWVGYDKHLEEGNQLSNADGTRQLPRRFYREIMTRLTEDSDKPDWEKPDSVKEVEVINGSNPAKEATASTPESQKITELFVEGHLPSDEQPQRQAPSQGQEETDQEENDQATDQTDETEEVQEEPDQAQPEEEPEPEPEPEPETEPEPQPDQGQEEPDQNDPDDGQGQEGQDGQDGQENQEGQNGQGRQPGQEGQERPRPQPDQGGQERPGNGGGQEEGQNQERARRARELFRQLIPRNDDENASEEDRTDGQ